MREQSSESVCRSIPDIPVSIAYIGVGSKYGFPYKESILPSGRTVNALHLTENIDIIGDKAGRDTAADSALSSGAHL